MNKSPGSEHFSANPEDRPDFNKKREERIRLGISTYQQEMNSTVNNPCHLIPKDPTKRGRAVLARVCHDYDTKLDFCVVYTDFGHVSKLTYPELIEIYEIGERVNLKEWVSDNVSKTHEMAQDWMNHIS